VTTTRHPGNPNFHPIPTRCADCGQFCGDWDSENPAIWERNDNWDLPDTYTYRCLDCATERVMKKQSIDDRDAARREVLGAVSG
jgi:hypothetical protein